MTLPDTFLTRPIAHRALHDLSDHRPENSLEAIEAAVAHGYGIEIDLQRSADGQAMVFHDYDLRRLTDETGPIAQRTANELGQITLAGGSTGIPTLASVLERAAGRVPLLIEIKDQDGRLGDQVGELENATARMLSGYEGPVAVMSFNPHSVAAMAKLMPDIPRGLTTCDFAKDDWQLIPKSTREHLKPIPDFDRTGACFISHQARDLAAPRVAELKANGIPILCWTIRSPEEEAAARRVADNVTFEGYLP